MAQQIPIDPNARADDPQADKERDDHTHQVAPDIAYKRLMLVNVAFVGVPNAGDRQWVLIDTAVPGVAGAIADACEERFGKNSRPAAILLTHGHFDHVGNLEELADRWDAPIYAHELEVPYLNGSAAYPPPDTGTGGGIMPLLAPLFPRKPIDVSARLHVLPADGGVPPLPGWQWIPTPGHTPGHVSFWRASDRMLIVGDAFVTTAQESAYSIATQKPEMHGPPMYFTQNFEESGDSVRLLAQLSPEIAVVGHGRAMEGQAMRNALNALAANFEQVAVPNQGKYVQNPARAADGTAYDTSMRK